MFSGDIHSGLGVAAWKASWKNNTIVDEFQTALRTELSEPHHVLRTVCPPTAAAHWLLRARYVKLSATEAHLVALEHKVAEEHHPVGVDGRASIILGKGECFIVFGLAEAHRVGAREGEDSHDEVLRDAIELAPEFDLAPGLESSQTWRVQSGHALAPEWRGVVRRIGFRAARIRDKLYIESFVRWMISPVIFIRYDDVEQPIFFRMGLGWEVQRCDSSIRHRCGIVVAPLDEVGVGMGVVSGTLEIVLELFTLLCI